MGKVKYKQISPELLKMASSIENTDRTMRSSLNNAMEAIEHYKIDIDKLIPYKNQARKGFNEEEIENLSISIKEHGIRQPLTVIQSSHHPTKYEVISGERRLRAAIKANMQKVPCIIISDYILAEEIALVENIQRQDLHPIELGEAFQNIVNSRKGLTQTALANKLGVSNKLVSETISYTKLPKEVKELLISKNIIGRDLIRKLIKSSDPMSLLLKSNSEKKNEINTKPMSVVRVILKEGRFTLQANNIKELPSNMKEELKFVIQKLYESLK